MNNGGQKCLAKTGMAFFGPGQFAFGLAKTKNRDFGPDGHQSVETNKMVEETDIDLS